ncbi:SDR family NAD(P)-dependent oxidoreductase, partial [Vibrio parahaemolyticus]
AQVKPIADVRQEDMDLIFKINVDGTMWGIQAASEKFKERKHKGKIINASSIAGHDGFAMLGVYSATKFAVRALTQTA